MLASELLGLEIEIENIGQNFVFAINGKRGGNHKAAEQALFEVPGPWCKRLQEIRILIQQRPVNLRDQEDEEFAYVYSTTQVVKKLLSGIEIPTTPDYMGENLFRSFKSAENLGVKIGEVLGVDLFTRFELETRGLEVCPDETEVSARRAESIGVEDDKILLRKDCTRIEFVLRSQIPPYRSADEAFDYASEQGAMRKAATLLYLTFAQHLCAKEMEVKKR